MHERAAGPDAGYRELNEARLFTDYEQLLFSKEHLSGESVRHRALTR